MSLVLKSNVVAENNLGTYKSLTSNAATELAAYKARVLADGGEIIDEAATLAAFQSLIDSGIYGIARVFIGAKYGMKRDGSGHITKLYSLDGNDLVQFNLGAGMPVTLVNNEISFSNNVIDPLSQTQGTIFTTQGKIKSYGRGLVVGVEGSRLTSSTSAEAGLAGFTLLDTVANASPLWLVTFPTATQTIISLRQMGETPNQNSTTTTQTARASMSTTGSKYTFFADHRNKKFKGYRNGVLTTLPDATSQFSNLDGFDGYINFGGYIQQSGVTKRYCFGNAAVSKFFVYDNLPEKKVELLSKL